MNNRGKMNSYSFGDVNMMFENYRVTISSKIMQRAVYFLIALIAISCNSASFKDFEQDLRYANNLKGNIKSIKTETFEASEIFDVTIKGESATPNFDLSTYLQAIIPLNSTIEFTKEGKLVLKEIKGASFSQSGKIIYDSNWNIVEELFTSNRNENITKYEITNNRPTSSTFYNDDGDVVNKANYVYDNGLLQEITTTGNDGEVLDRTTFSYADGVETKDVYYTSGKLIRTYKTDIFGRHLEILSPGGFLNNKIIIQYDGKNPVPTKILTYSDNDLESTLIMTLDDLGNIVEIKEIGEVETIYSYAYKYDKKGNWLERTTYVDGEIKYITTRTIKYF